MATHLFTFELWDIFTDQEYTDLMIAACIDPSDPPGQQMKAAKIKRMIDRINSQKSVNVETLEGALGILVSEGVLTGPRLSQVISDLKAL